MRLHVPKHWFEGQKFPQTDSTEYVCLSLAVTVHFIVSEIAKLAMVFFFINVIQMVFILHGYFLQNTVSVVAQ